MKPQFEMQSDEIIGNIYDKHLYARLLKYVKPYISSLIIAFILLMFITTFEVIVPLLTKYAVDNHIVSDKRILTLNPDEFNHFKQNSDISKFKVYLVNDLYYVVVTSKTQGYIKKDTLKQYKTEHKFSEKKFFVLDYTKESLKILNKYQSDIIILNINELLVSSETLAKLSLSETNVVRKKSLHMVMIYGLIFLCVIVLKLIVQYFQLILTTILSQKAMNDLRSDLFKHLERMPLSFFDKNPVGRLVTRITNDIRSIDEMLSSGIITIFQDAIMIVAIMSLMLFLNWKLALVSFIVLPFLFWIINVYKNKTRVTYREVRKRLAAVNAMIAEHISGVKIIQLFNQSQKKTKEFEQVNDGYFKESINQLKLFAIFRPIISVSRQVAVALILWYAGGQILNNLVTIGVFMAFMSYLDRLYEPINDFSEKFNILQGAMAGAERIFDLMDQPQADYQEYNLAHDSIDGSIEFKNVWLSYQTEQNEKPEFVLKNVSFKVNPGEKIAIVGHTGSGKTSIVNLILGMYPYQKGDIFIDDKNLKDYQIRDIRKQIGMVQQDVFLFSGTIRDNIALNNLDMTENDLVTISKYVNVYDFIQALPGKFEEPVMERGSTFSVGQRQLISFARVLAYNPSIFILDEATANIDTETENLIQDALQKLMENRTSMIIAHRLSTIQHVDRIIVLHKGEVVEEGSHQELLQKEGLYYDLYRLQYT